MSFLVTKDIYYIGVKDSITDLFEGQYKIPEGITYNSYIIKDDKTAVVDSVDHRFCEEWFKKIDEELCGEEPDYLIVQHMEPDHSSSIDKFAQRYKSAVIVSSAKAFAMMKQFFGTEYEDRRIVADANTPLELGSHILKFMPAPMVHWPEVMMTYDEKDKVFFSADGFGKFGIPSSPDNAENWDDEARRYYIGIVGKYGVPVQTVLKKAATLDIEVICPLHGPVLKSNLSHYLGLYDIWSSYKAEKEGVCIAYTSVYGNTKKAAEKLYNMLREKNVPAVIYDLARSDMSQVVAEAFRYDRLVLATTTYNAEIFPFMREFIAHLTERGFKNRKVGLIENGSWASVAAKKMKELLPAEPAITYTETTVSIKSALDEQSEEQLLKLAEEME